MLFLLCSLFFFKHKTTYEMRISDWSSDVCSSDRADRGRTHRRQRRTDAAGAAFAWQSGRGFRALEVERGHPSPHRSSPAAAGGVGIERKSVVSGTRVSVRGDLGGRSSIENKSLHVVEVRNEEEKVKK